MNFNEISEELLYHTSEKILHFLQTPDGRPINPILDKEEIVNQIQSSFNQELPHKKAVEAVLRNLESYTVHTSHPTYFGLFNPRPLFSGVIADMLTVAVNPQLAAWSHAPYANEVENFMVTYFSKKFGLPAESDGIFCSGGAESNQTAVLCALHHAFPNFSQEGILGIGCSPRIYCSEEVHHSVFKAARVSGLGVQSVVPIKINKDFSMDMEILENAIMKDQKCGMRPFMVVGTAGTTGIGAIDTLTELKELSQKHNLWFHVDAAWGGGAILSSNLKLKLVGIESADSITMDAHKWLCMPMGTSLFLTKHKNILENTFGTPTEYMPKDAQGIQITDPYNHSLAWSRRSLGIRLYLSFLLYGEGGLANLVNSLAQKGEELRQLLNQEGWEIWNNSPFPVLCFRIPGMNNEQVLAICKKVVKRGKVWLSTYPVKGKICFRACITNYLTETQHLKALLEELKTAMNEVDT